MVIDVSVQDNGGLLPDIILLTQYYYKTETMCMPIHACIGNEDSLQRHGATVPPDNFLRLFGRHRD